MNITKCNLNYENYADKEYLLDDGYGDYITFNIIETNIEREIITVAVTYLGKITINTYDLYEDAGAVAKCLKFCNSPNVNTLLKESI